MNDLMLRLMSSGSENMRGTIEEPIMRRKHRFATLLRFANTLPNHHMTTEQQRGKEKVGLDDTVQRLSDAGVTQFTEVISDSNNNSNHIESRNSMTHDGNKFNQEKLLHRRVSFADSLGYDLESIKIITEGRDTPPMLHNCQLHVNDSPVNSKPLLSPAFVQPVANFADYLRQLSENCVCLESLVITENVMTGLVKVKNISYTKSVKVRYTTDDWKSYDDLDCYYLNPSFGTSRQTAYDSFNFQIDIDNKWDTFEFCISYTCQGQTFWDNNYGENYKLLRQ